MTSMSKVNARLVCSLPRVTLSPKHFYVLYLAKKKLFKFYTYRCESKIHVLTSLCLSCHQLLDLLKTLPSPSLRSGSPASHGDPMLKWTLTQFWKCIRYRSETQSFWSKFLVSCMFKRECIIRLIITLEINVNTKL